MPIYMDRHDVSEEVTAMHVAQLHKADLKIQHKFECRGLTYWFDEQRKTAFCLIEAPNKTAIKKMHDHAHGELPHKIIEVDNQIVESFLGRIEDPKKSKNTKLNIINEPAFRSIMVVALNKVDLNKKSLKNFHQFIIASINSFHGRVVKQNNNSFLVSFRSVSEALFCALEIQLKFKETEHTNLNLNVGLSAGIPVTERENIFEDTISSAKRMCDVVKGAIVISSEVRDLFESENHNKIINRRLVQTLSSSDEKFLKKLMDYTDSVWYNSNLKVEDFSNFLGLSKSQLYRRMKALSGKSPNAFIKNYRLSKAVKLLDRQKSNISEIAYETGFNSPAYFSKCFLENFDILPSHYLKRIKYSH